MVAVGAEVAGTVPGDRVAWGHALGSYAELVVVPAAEAIAIPAGLDTDVAAAVLELARAGHLDVHVQPRYRLEAAGCAHDDLASGTTTGKLLVLPWR